MLVGFLGRPIFGATLELQPESRKGYSPGRHSGAASGPFLPGLVAVLRPAAINAFFWLPGNKNAGSKGLNVFQDGFNWLLPAGARQRRPRRALGCGAGALRLVFPPPQEPGGRGPVPLEVLKRIAGNKDAFFHEADKDGIIT